MECFGRILIVQAESVDDTLHRRFRIGRAAKHAIEPHRRRRIRKRDREHCADNLQAVCRVIREWSVHHHVGHSGIIGVNRRGADGETKRSHHGAFRPFDDTKHRTAMEPRPTTTRRRCHKHAVTGNRVTNPAFRNEYVLAAVLRRDEAESAFVNRDRTALRRLRGCFCVTVPAFGVDQSVLP